MVSFLVTTLTPRVKRIHVKLELGRSLNIEREERKVRFQSRQNAGSVKPPVGT